MKVIKKGKRQGWTKRVTCTGNGNGGFGCGAILADLRKRIQEFQIC